LGIGSFPLRNYPMLCIYCRRDQPILESVGRREDKSDHSLSGHPQNFACRCGQAEPSLDPPISLRNHYSSNNSGQSGSSENLSDLIPSWARTLHTGSELSKNTHEGFHKVLIIDVPCGPLINISCADVQKECLFVGDKTLFHLSQ